MTFILTGSTVIILFICADLLKDVNWDSLITFEMFEEKHIPNRALNEHLITFVRPHWLYLLKSMSLFALMFALPIGAYYIISETFPILLEVELLYVIAVFTATLYYLVTFLLLYNQFIDYHLDIWIVTNMRIIAIVQNNIFNRTISEHKLDVIQDVTANQKGLLQTMLNFGDVLVQTAAEKEKFHFNDVPNPFEVARQINELVRSLKK